MFSKRKFAEKFLRTFERKLADCACYFSIFFLFICFCLLAAIKFQNFFVTKTRTFRVIDVTFAFYLSFYSQSEKVFLKFQKKSCNHIKLTTLQSFLEVTVVGSFRIICEIDESLFLCYKSFKLKDMLLVCFLLNLKQLCCRIFLKTKNESQQKVKL